MPEERIKIIKEPEEVDEIVAALTGKVHEIEGNLEQLARRLDDILKEIDEESEGGKYEDEEVK